MAVTREKNGTWTVQCWYRDWTGERRKKTKRGFKTKLAAKEWQSEFELKTAGSPDMPFSAFFQLYKQDAQARLKHNTWHNREYLIKDKILPFFGEKKLSEITPADILAWQTHLLGARNPRTGEPYSRTYLRTVHNTLSTMFNHAVRYYNLPANPVRRTGQMGSQKPAQEMLVWTKDEYLAFADEMMDKPQSFALFELLYWCGIREGEALALTPEDFDFAPEQRLLTISKSYQRIGTEDVITPPKTERSNRTIKMPDFVAEEVEEYIELAGIEPGERLFPVTKSFLYHEMERGCKEACVKRIRVHDLRHSHVSMLIEMGFSVVSIADRMGHESTDITLRYAHMFPNTQEEMAGALSKERRCS